MKTKVLFLALALSTLCASNASAYSLTCGDIVDIFTYGTDEDQMLAVGHLAGTADMVATMLCFGGDRRCNCLKNVVVNQPEALADAYVGWVQSCLDGDPAVGPAFNAVLQVCR
jgi:hypothetical protein